MTEVFLTEDARDDLDDLDGATQQAVLKALKKLRTEPEKRGTPLGSKAGGNLTTFRKLVVGDRDFRIVYRVEPDGSVVVVWVIAAQRRRGVPPGRVAPTNAPRPGGPGVRSRARRAMGEVDAHGPADRVLLPELRTPVRSD